MNSNTTNRAREERAKKYIKANANQNDLDRKDLELFAIAEIQFDRQSLAERVKATQKSEVFQEEVGVRERINTKSWNRAINEVLALIEQKEGE